MPRSMQDILDHAADLAKRFEEFDPAAATEIPVEEFVLRRAVIERATSEQRLLEAVAGARSSGMTWQAIGAVLGTSAQAAQQRYAHAVERR